MSIWGGGSVQGERRTTDTAPPLRLIYAISALLLSLVLALPALAGLYRHVLRYSRALCPL